MAFHVGRQGCTWLVGLLVCTSACGAPEAGGDEVSLDVERGQLRLPLLTTNTDTFRLSQALFQLESASGNRLLTLDSDIDPEAEQLEAELAEGSYRSLLDSGWVLQRIADDGTAVPVNAALLTPNPTPFEIRNDRITDVNYTFSTDQGSITLGEGQVRITLDVTAQPIPISCSPLNNFGCPQGQTCLLAGDAEATYCASSGTLPVGAECSSEQCVAGAQCLALDADEPTRRTCTRFCSMFNNEFGCNCTSAGASDENLGVCGPLPPGACDLLTQTGCAPGQACQHTSGAFGSCGPAGIRGQRELCNNDSDCAPGFDCFNGFFGQGACSAFCDIQQGQFEACSEFGTFCSSVGTGTIGRCN
jgi:hypothetical protein